MYDESLWSTHLDLSKDLFLANYLASIKDNYSKNEFINMYGEFIGTPDIIGKIWPERILKESEHDVIYKHYASLMLASYYDGLSLVIEDDAYWKEEDTEKIAGILRWQLKESQKNIQAPIYHDLCNYKHFLDMTNRESHNKKTRFGVTRTLCSYLINALSANLLIDKFQPYSLPADFHLQTILRCEPRITGYLTLPGVIINGSLNNIFNSSIQSFT